MPVCMCTCVEPDRRVCVCMRVCMCSLINMCACVLGTEVSVMQRRQPVKTYRVCASLHDGYLFSSHLQKSHKHTPIHTLQWGEIHTLHWGETHTHTPILP